LAYVNAVHTTYLRTLGENMVLYLIIELANELQVPFVFKLMVDRLLKHNTLTLL